MTREARRFRRRFASTALRAGAVLLAAVAVADAQPDSVNDHHALSPTFTTWLSAVAHHAAGTPDAHAVQAAALPDTALREVLREFDALEKALERAIKRRRPFRPRGTDAGGQLLSTAATLALVDLEQDDAGLGGSLGSLVRRGALLHTDLAVLLHDGRIVAPASGSVDKHGAISVLDGQPLGFGRRWPHWQFARDLLSRRLHDPDDARVAERWYVAAAAYMYARGRLVDLLPHIEEGERRFDTSADVLFFGGLLHAKMASPPLQQAIRQAALPTGRTLESSTARVHLQQARRLLTRAIEADPDMTEARVRLGHVLLELRQAPEAIGHLDKALASDMDVSLRYCAELFLGDALAAVGDGERAREAFGRASMLLPQAPSAWLSLSRLTRAQGDHTGAAALLGRAVTPAPAARRVEDPWWSYYQRDAATPERLLDAWRADVTTGRGAP